MKETCAKLNVFFKTMARKASGRMLAAIAVAALLPASGQVIHAQAAAPANNQAKQYDLVQPGAQTIAIGKYAYGAQKAGRIKCEIRVDQGDLSGTLVLKMLSKDGEDLAPQQKLLGWYDPTREVTLKELKAGSPVHVNEAFVSGPGTAAIGVELKVEVTKAPCSIWIGGVSLEERAGEEIVSDEGGTLVTTPEKDFAYPRNLVPAMDSSEWKAAGEGAKRGRGPAGQTVLALDEKTGGKWESPIVPLPEGVKELCLQAFMKFDRLAMPFDHPYQVVIRDREGKILSKKGRAWWPCWEWNHAYGQWIPLSIRIAAPERAASVQLVMELNKGSASTGAGTGEESKNNFIVFQTAGLKLWAESKPSSAAQSPYNFTNYAGGAADAGPFTACTPQQQNSIALWTATNDTSNLYFSKEGKWPAPRTRVENYLPIRRTLELKGEVFDWHGNSLGKVSCPVKIEPFECKDIELPAEVAVQSGIYSLELDAMQDGALVGQGVIRWGYFREPSDRADRRDLQYPFCFHSSYSAQGGDAPRYMDWEGRTLRAMGVRGFRLQCRLWALNGTDSEKAIASIQNYSDRFHKEVWPFMQKYGFDGFISFFPKPRSPIPAANSPELEAWKKYVAAAVKLYPEISTFAFGNEEVGSEHKDLDVRPGVWGYTGNMRDYTREFLAAREAAREARPDATFIIGQASDPTSNVARLFFEAGGTGKDVQGWAINSYGNAAATWKNLSDMLKRNGVDMSKVVGLIPEIGYGVPRRGSSRLVGERGEAIQLVYQHVETLAVAPWVRDICWFTTVSRGPVVHNFVFDTDWAPKPMVGAYLTMSASLGAGRPTRVADLPGANVYLWQRPDGSKAGVLWAPGRQRLRVRVGDTRSPVIVRDIMGNDTEALPKEGVISVEVSPSPIYLLNIQTLEDGSDIREQWTLQRAPDGARQAKVEIRNRTDKSLRIEGRFEGSPKVTWASPDVAPFDLAAGESKVVAQRFSLADEDFADSKTLTLMLKVNGVETASDYASSLLTARRTSASPDVKSWEKADKIVMNQLRQMTSSGIFRWKGPDDLSSRTSLLWDDQNLYLHVVVTDDTNVQITEVGSMFMNDNLQLAFTVNTADKESRFTELSLGVSHGQPAAYQRANGVTGVADAQSVRLNVTRDEAAKTTVYDAAIAWKALGVAEPKAGQHLRFEILVNDSDQPGSTGKDRQGIQWFGGIFEKAPSRHGDLTLSD